MGYEIKDSGVRQAFTTGSVRDTDKGKPRYDLIPTLPLRRVAMHYGKGAEKYDEDNWKLGQPSKRFLGSLLRHIFAYCIGDRSEDHLAAVVFNCFGIMWNEDVRPDLDDIMGGYYAPEATKGKSNGN